MAFPAVWAITANSLTAETFRQATSSLLSGAGVVGGPDLAVSQNSTPNMTVNVAAGQVWIPGTLSSATGFPTNATAQTGYGLPSTFNEQGCYYAWNNGTDSVTISAADPTNPRIDIIVAYVQDAQYSGSSNTGVIGVITGTAAPSPVAPSAPASAVVLAQVAVAANATSISTANITDERPSAQPISQVIPVCRVYRNGAYTDVNTTPTICPFDTVQAENTPSFNTSTYLYTVPTTGLYLVAGAWQATATSTAFMSTFIYKNGAQWAQGSMTNYAATANLIAASVSDIVTCAAGDTLALWYQDGGGHAINTGSSKCWMSIARIGRSS